MPKRLPKIKRSSVVPDANASSSLLLSGDHGDLVRTQTKRKREDISCCSKDTCIESLSSFVPNVGKTKKVLEAEDFTIVGDWKVLKPPNACDCPVAHTRSRAHDMEWPPKVSSRACWKAYDASKYTLTKKPYFPTRKQMSLYNCSALPNIIY